MNKTKVNIIAALLLTIFAILAITSIWPDRKSATADELAHHIPVGYVLLSKGDFKMDPSQPPLSRYLAALPLKLFMNLNMPDDKEEWRREDRSEFGKDFFYKYNDQPHRMLFYSRCSFILIGIICGIVLFFMARDFYGERAALFSLFLYSLSPDMLAHTRLSTADMTATCFILLSVYTFWKFVCNKSVKNMVIAGICMGLAQLSKYTALLLYPIFILLAVFELPSIVAGKKVRLFKKLLVIFIVSIIVLWAGYGFDFDPILNDTMRVQEKLGIAHNFAQKIVPFWNERMSQALDYALFNVPVPLGAHMQGILGVIKHGHEGRSVYFLGEWSSRGNILYFVASFLVKTPIPSIIFIFTGLFLVFKRGVGRNERFLLTMIAVIFITASLSKLQLGHRYILAMYPFCFILAGRSMDLWKKLYKIPVTVLMVWYAASAVWIWPHYLNYFNEVIGGPKNGYLYFRDSNVDWGQDLPALAAYMKKENVEKIKLLYFWPADPKSYGIEYNEFTDEDRLAPNDGEVYVIDIHSFGTVKWGKRYEPSAHIGYSMFVYDFRESMPEIAEK